MDEASSGPVEFDGMVALYDSSNNFVKEVPYSERHDGVHFLRSAYIVLRNDQGSILLEQRSDKVSRPLKWNVPGGLVDRSESPDDCAVRELKEELGITVLLKLFGIVKIDELSTGARIFKYIYEGLYNSLPKDSLNWEVLDVRFFSEQEILDIMKTDKDFFDPYFISFFADYRKVLGGRVNG
ncbi:NUDIX hydrolase [Candidatus Woesearchaeota archaeon]|nr:NUDIX hydrolase [Candidatus Woesearchaeota archaeon]